MREDDVGLVGEDRVEAALVRHRDELDLGGVAEDGSGNGLAEVDVEAFHLARRGVQVAEAGSGVVGTAVQYAALLDGIKNGGRRLTCRQSETGKRAGRENLDQFHCIPL